MAPPARPRRRGSGVDPLDIRGVINEGLRRRGQSRYWLSHSGLVDMSINGVMRYLAGKHDTHGRTIGQMLHAVGARIVLPEAGKEVPHEREQQAVAGA